MRKLVIDNYIIDKPIYEILQRLQLVLTNGKLKDIKTPGGSDENIVCTCPHHDGGRESHPACNIYIGDDPKIQYGYFRCFVCGEKGTFLKFVAECFDSSEEYAKDWLIRTFGGELIERKTFTDEPIVISKKRSRTTGLDQSILDQYQNWHPYLATRKLSRETCEAFNVKYDPKTRQVIFPCYDLKGNLIMMPRRSIDRKTFYLDKDIEKPVYCLNYIVKNNVKSAIITEGPIDCLTGWEYGYPTCATLGTPSDYQIDQLNHSGLSVLYAMFDNDAAGRSFTATLKKKLTNRIILIEIRIPDGKKDINDLNKTEFLEILKKYKSC